MAANGNEVESTNTEIIKKVFSDFDRPWNVVLFKYGTFVIGLSREEAISKLKEFPAGSGAGSNFGDFNVLRQDKRFPDRFISLVCYCYPEVCTIIESEDGVADYVVGLQGRNRRSQDVQELEIVDSFGSE